MDSSDLPTIERIQHLARSILGCSELFSTEIECYNSVITPIIRLQKMQASANEIKSLTQGLLEGSARQPRSFSLFPMLPVELRLKIWKLALPGPRIVEVYLDRVVPDLDRSYYHEDILRVNTPPPALMHVNWESRSIALEKYWLRLGNAEVKDDFTRIDPAEDTIFIPWPILDCGEIFIDRLINGTAWSEEARNAVRSMAVDERTWRELSGPSNFIYFENLEKYTLVAHESYDICWEGWRKPNTDLCFVDLDDEEEIEELHCNVESRMRDENRDYNRQWELPVIEVKVAARGGKKCCFD